MRTRTTGWRSLAGSLAVLTAAFAAPITAHACLPDTDRIDASCYTSLQSAVEVAVTRALPLWLPAGTYVLPQTLFIDYTPLANVGFTIISDGAVVDGRTMRRPVIEVQCQRDCFYLHLVGTLTVWADVPDASFQLGSLGMEPHNSVKIDHLVVNNSDPLGTAVRFNYVLNADASVYAVGGYTGLWMRQTQFSRVNGAMTGVTGYGILIDDGYTFANTLSGVDVEGSPVCLAVTSPYANRNTFVSPYLNCTTPVVATAGVQNVLLNASYGASSSPAPASLIGVVSIP
jgi:hypothetical protein